MLNRISNALYGADSGAASLATKLYGAAAEGLTSLLDVVFPAPTGTATTATGAFLPAVLNRISNALYGADYGAAALATKLYWASAEGLTSLLNVVFPAPTGTATTATGAFLPAVLNRISNALYGADSGVSNLGLELSGSSVAGTPGSTGITGGSAALVFEATGSCGASNYLTGSTIKVTCTTTGTTVTADMLVLLAASVGSVVESRIQTGLNGEVYAKFVTGVAGADSEIENAGICDVTPITGDGCACTLQAIPVCINYA